MQLGCPHEQYLFRDYYRPTPLNKKKKLIAETMGVGSQKEPVPRARPTKPPSLFCCNTCISTMVPLGVAKWVY